MTSLPVPHTRRGRPSRPYRTTWGEEVHGLYRSMVRPNQWRVVATDERFTERDERRAVLIFREKMRDKTATVTIPLVTAPLQEVGSKYGEPNTPTEDALIGLLNAAIVQDDQVTFTPQIDEAKIWAWVREQLITNPEYVAKRTGIPEIVRLRQLLIPKDPIPLADIWAAYESRNSSKKGTKKASKRIWKSFLKHTGATTLEHLTTEKLQAYCDSVEKTASAPASRKLYYARIRTIIAFGLRCGLDAEQIRAALDRVKVLWTAARIPAPKPKPISQNDFHALLQFASANQDRSYWRGWLLTGLNLCLHIGEVCELKWEEFDLKTGTYAAIRGKTEEHRIPRAATLWPETLDALIELKHNAKQSPYVFVSRYGTKFHRNNRVNAFKEFRDLAGRPYVTFDSIRDGAYTAACQLCPDERWARLLAGHRSPGLQDSYVLRNPKIVAPACDAVYKAYGPFPQKR